MVRRNDLDTSYAAAEHVIPRRNQLQLRLLEAITTYGAMTDQQLEDLPEFRRYAYSTVRKRRTELYQRHELVITGETINSRGVRMKIWDLTERAQANREERMIDRNGQGILPI